jgi:hypothetical protein
MSHTRESRPQGAAIRTGEVQASIPTARAYAGPPCRGRSLWLVVVLTCPRCGTAHTHRVGEAARLLSHRVEKCCPVTGQWYLLGPVQRRREARRG